MERFEYTFAPGIKKAAQPPRSTARTPNNHRKGAIKPFYDSMKGRIIKDYET